MMEEGDTTCFPGSVVIHSLQVHDCSGRDGSSAHRIGSATPWEGSGLSPRALVHVGSMTGSGVAPAVARPRWLSNDEERRGQMSETFLTLAMIRRMGTRVAKQTR
jgi:hypothetical protein